MTRLETISNGLGKEVGVDPVLVVTVLMGLLSCLKDEDESTPAEQIPRLRVLVATKERRVHLAARKYARKAGVPRSKVHMVATRIVHTIKMANDEEIRAVCEEMK